MSFAQTYAVPRFSHFRSDPFDSAARSGRLQWLIKKIYPLRMHEASTDEFTSDSDCHACIWLSGRQETPSRKEVSNFLTYTLSVR
jgi:hypothetical protein